jgi:hypothetical protein
VENSILISTKKVLGLDAAYTVFDQDVIMHINAAFSILNQLGVGPVEGFMIEDDTAVWDDFILLEGTEPSKSLIKTYVQLKSRMLFDPPTTSFLLEAMTNQIKEYEWRLNVFREYSLPPEEVTDELNRDWQGFHRTLRRSRHALGRTEI